MNVNVRDISFCNNKINNDFKSFNNELCILSDDREVASDIDFIRVVNSILEEFRVEYLNATPDGNFIKYLKFIKPFQINEIRILNDKQYIRNEYQISETDFHSKVSGIKFAKTDRYPEDGSSYIHWKVEYGLTAHANKDNETPTVKMTDILRINYILFITPVCDISNINLDHKETIINVTVDNFICRACRPPSDTYCGWVSMEHKVGPIQNLSAKLHI